MIKFQTKDKFYYLLINWPLPPASFTVLPPSIPPHLPYNSPLKLTLPSVSILQITAVHTESLVEGAPVPSPLVTVSGFISGSFLD